MPQPFVRRGAWPHLVTFLCALAAVPAAAAPAPALVSVDNQTHATRCAEEDNVSLVLTGPAVRRFRVEALPPAYLREITEDRTAPDFSNCNFDGGAHPTDPRFAFDERRAVLHDGPRWTIVGITLPSFWRPQRVPVRIDGRKDRGFHMIQVFAKPAGGGKPLEAIVFYPSDGYWRIKPLPEARFGDGVYGSSFLMGPVERDGRPVVNIASIAIRSRPLAVQLRFADGGEARIKAMEISEARTALDVALAPGRLGISTFAVLRSMYVAPDNADMSEVAWRAAPDAPQRSKPLPDVKRIDAADVRFGRSVPSKHNTSAPDIRFSGFADRARR